MTKPQTEQWGTTVRSLKETAAQSLRHQSAEEFKHFERLLNPFDGLVGAITGPILLSTNAG